MATTFSNDEVDRIVEEKLVNRFCKGYSTYGKGNVCLTKYYKDYAEDIENLEIDDSDVIVASFPKAGTTWAQEMVWLLCNDLDYEGAKVTITERFPFLELCTLFDLPELGKTRDLPIQLKSSVDFVRQLESPRLIKTHLPYSLLPAEIRNGSKSPKIIYVTRNAKDVCTSYYYHTTIMPLGTTATLEEFAKVFLSDKVPYAPFWPHVLEYWAHKNDPNVLIINYEDMKMDLPQIIENVAKFLGKQLNDDEMEGLCKHLSFKSMKNNRSVNYEEVREIQRKQGLVKVPGQFMRSGTVGQYKEEMSPEVIKMFDEWIKKHIEGTDFGSRYDYNL